MKGTLKMRERKMRDLKMRHRTARIENAGLESAGNDIVWNAAHCLCLLSFCAMWPPAVLCIMRGTTGATGSRLPDMLH